MSIIILISKTLRSRKNACIRGFTLVELLVVLGLFSSIATLSLGALFNAQAINSHLQETQAILDNVNLSVQSITRDVRFGSHFVCMTSGAGYVPSYVSLYPANCTYVSGPGNVLGFKPSDAATTTDRTAFYVTDGALYKREFKNPLNPAEYTDSQMTSNDVEIRDLVFYVDGAEPATSGDYKQPLVIMLISGQTKPLTSTVPPVEFNLEIAMSSREPDNQ